MFYGAIFVQKMIERQSQITLGHQVNENCSVNSEESVKNVRLG